MKRPDYPGCFDGQSVGIVRYKVESGKSYLLVLNEFEPDETVIRKRAMHIVEYPAWIWTGRTWEKPVIGEPAISSISFDKAAASAAFRKIMGRGERVTPDNHPPKRKK